MSSTPDSEGRSLGGKQLPEDNVILSIRGLKTYFYTYAGVVKALDGIDLDVYAGETLGLVGETGCGKSVTALSVLRIVPSPPGRIVAGQILFKGEDLLQKSEVEMQKLRGSKIAMVFQDPMTYLNPVIRIGDQIAEPIILHQNLMDDYVDYKVQELKVKIKKKHKSGDGTDKLESGIANLKRNPPKQVPKNYVKKIAKQKSIEILKLVRMPYADSVVDNYPHELSGGMRQRAMIAMALSCKPDIFIADEATTALDVTIQAQILTLMNDLKKEVGSTNIIITHDMGIIAETCDRAAVMYAGTIVELARVEDLFKYKLHPYTQGLFAAIPDIRGKQSKLETIPGMVPNLINPPTGCRFHPRCKHAMAICSKNRPQMFEERPNHFVACYLYGNK
jgi:oligopeptide/dipeptide ABC transporter ATP-binding protein